MTALSIQPTYPIFTDIDGQPLEDGYVWIGTANLDPQTNPINVYWDAALTLPAAQPIRTLAGYPANSGTPARLYVNSDYSIRVMNKNGSVVYSAPAATERYSGVVINGVNAEDVIYDPPFLGGVQTNVEAKLAQTVSVEDFGAVGDYDFGTGTGTDNTAAFRAAVASGATRIYVPAGIYYLSDGVALNYGQGIYGDGYREKSWLVFADTLATTDYGISLGDGGWCEKMRIGKQTNVKTDTGISFNVAAGTSKWCRVRDVYIDDWQNGIWTSSYYHTIESCILVQNKYGIKLGGAGVGPFFAGSTTMIGCYFRDNSEAGIYVAINTNTNSCYNCTWEVNQVHVICDGRLSIFGGYLADPPVSPVLGSGQVYINLGSTDPSAALYGGSDGTAYGKNTITGTDYAYGIRIGRATLENVIVGINEQSRSVPSPGSVLRGSIIGQGIYTMNNVKFSSASQIDALNVLEQSTTITQQILSNGIPIKNYVNNGLFLDRVKAADPLYITANGGMQAGANNPWGGGVLLMSRFGSRIRWTVPDNNVGKQHYLMIYKGVVQGTGSTSSGPGIDTASSTNLTFDVSTPNIVQIGSQYSPNVYALQGGFNQGGRITIGLSVVLVTPTATTGEIRLSYNASDATTYIQIFGIVMTERNDVGDTEAEGWPIGWFDTAQPLAL